MCSTILNLHKFANYMETRKHHNSENFKGEIFTGEILNQLTFHGSGHPWQFNPLKLNKWKGLKWLQTTLLHRFPYSSLCTSGLSHLAFRLVKQVFLASLLVKQTFSPHLLPSFFTALVCSCPQWIEWLIDLGSSPACERIHGLQMPPHACRHTWPFICRQTAGNSRQGN